MKLILLLASLVVFSGCATPGLVSSSTIQRSIASNNGPTLWEKELSRTEVSTVHKGDFEISVLALPDYRVDDSNEIEPGPDLLTRIYDKRTGVACYNLPGDQESSQGPNGETTVAGAPDVKQCFKGN